MTARSTTETGDYPPKKIHVSLPEDLHKKVKVKCAYEDLSIQSYVEKLIREDMKGYSVEIEQKD